MHKQGFRLALYLGLLFCTNLLPQTVHASLKPYEDDTGIPTLTISDLTKVLAEHCQTQRSNSVKTPLEKALDEECNLRDSTSSALKDLMRTIVELRSNKSFNAIAANIQERIDTDKAFIAQLNKALKEKENDKPKFIPGETVSFPFYHNKLWEAVNGANELLHSHLNELLQGKAPAGYAYQQLTVTQLGDNPTTIFGNPKGTYLKTALFYIILSLDAPSGSFLSFFKELQAQMSPCYHRTPWPQDLDPKDYQGFSFFMKGENAWPAGYLFFPHSGYTFGGDRYHPGSNPFKVNPPEDCSSAVAKWIGVPQELDTLALLYWYRKQKEVSSFIDLAWQNTPLVKDLDCLKPVTVDGPKDIFPGDLYVIRKFSYERDPSMTKTRGAGGHVAVVVQVKANLVETISYSRDIENGIEGLGLKDFPIFSSIEPENGLIRKIMFFRVQKG